MISLTVYQGNTPQGTIEVTDSDTFPLALSKSNADIRDITKRRGVFSKNFKILATANNNRVLKYIYNANVTAQVYRDCVLSYNNAEVLRGKIQCLSVAQTKQGEEYNLVVYANSVDWYFLLNGKLIGDYQYGNEEIASFGMTNGQLSGVIPAGNTSTLSRAYIEASWRNKDKFDYVYNLVSYGAPVNGTFVAEEDLRPSIYIAKILQKAFAGIGYTLSSDFFTTGIGASLILQYTGDGFTKSGLFDFVISAFGDVLILSNTLPVVTGTQQQYVVEQVIPNQIIEDPSNVYNVGTGLITITETGDYEIEFDGAVTFTANTGEFFLGDFSIIIRDSVTQQDYFTFAVPPLLLPRIRANSTAFPSSANIAFGNSVSLQNLPVGTYEIVFRFGYIGGGDITVVLDSDSSFTQTFQRNITAGRIYNVNSTLPQYKVLDILGGLQNMFNLYFETDNLNKTVSIEPKPVLIKPISDGVDYSDRLDVGNQIQTDFITAYNRFLRFRFKDDSNDKFQESFNLQRGTIYGSTQYDLGSDFKDGFTDTGNKYFAATLVYDTHPWTPQGERCPVPVLWNVNAPSPPKSYSFEPRILYYKGYEDVFLKNGRKAAWNWLGTLLTTVPSSFMVDPNVNEPNPVNIIYTDSEVANGLARTYYNSDIAVISDRRIHKAYFSLTATQFYQLDLYKPIFIDHPNFRGWYYVNQVIDFTPNREKTSQFELIRAYQSIPNNRPVASEIPTIQGGTRQLTSMGGGTRPSGLQSVNESAVLHNGSGNVGLIRGGGVIMGNAGIQSAINQHVFGNYNYINDAIYVLGAGNANERYNGLQFTLDGRVLEHGGKIYVTVNDVRQGVTVDMEVDGNVEISPVYLTGNR